MMGYVRAGFILGVFFLLQQQQSITLTELAVHVGWLSLTALSTQFRSYHAFKVFKVERTILYILKFNKY